MKRSVVMTCIVSISAVVLGILVAHGRVITQSTPGSHGLVPQPASWVAFQADVTVTYSDGSPRVEGRFVRASDGSTRLETGETRGTPKVIDISNVELLRNYVMTPDGKWTDAPIGVASADEIRPVQIRVDMAGLTKYSKRLALLDGQSGSVTAASGLSAYHYVNGSFTQQLLVPELNLFPVLRNRLDGRREIYTNINLAEPPRDVFQLPPGVVVTTLAERPRRARTQRER